MTPGGGRSGKQGGRGHVEEGSTPSRGGVSSGGSASKQHGGWLAGLPMSAAGRVAGGAGEGKGRDSKREKTMAALKADMQKVHDKVAKELKKAPLFSDSELESGTDQGTGRSGTEVSQTDDSEDSNMSDSGAGFLGGIGSFDAFLNNVQSHVTPGFAGKRKGAGRAPDDRTAMAGGAGAARGAAGGSKELKTKQRLILVYWLSQLGKASDPDGSCARACMSRCRVCFLCL